jgi:hypothetical protein
MTEPTIGVNTIPYNVEELQGHTCSACACYFESVNPEDVTQFQGFCRRLPAQVTKVRGQVPRLDTAGKPILRDGQPVMNSAEIVGYLFQPTQREGTCFDGWREKGTLPGAANSQKDLQELRSKLQTVLQSVGPQFLGRAPE